MAISDVAGLILPAVGMGAGAAIAGPGGAMIGGSVGGMAASGIRAATAEPPEITGATGAQQNIFAQQTRAAEESRMQRGLDPAQVANLDFATIRRNIRMMNVIDSRSQLYNIDPAARQEIVDSFTEEQQAEAVRTNRALLSADLEKEMRDRELETRSLQAAEMTASRIRAARREREVAIQDFNQAISNSLFRSLSQGVSAIGKAAVYMDAQDGGSNDTGTKADTDPYAGASDEEVAETSGIPGAINSSKSLSSIWG